VPVPLHGRSRLVGIGFIVKYWWNVVATDGSSLKRATIARPRVPVSPTEILTP
jgi:hypothetical protein